MKPIIGLIPLVDMERESYWMLPGYMDGIREAGGVPVILPLTDDDDVLEQMKEVCDGFVFTGGHDVSPELYREEKLPECGRVCQERDRMETLLWEKVIDADKPILGICRGLQFMNVVLGGSLYQDLMTQRPLKDVHDQTAPYHLPVHSVNIVLDSPIYNLSLIHI